MIRIIDKRGSGKTSRLFRLATKEHAIVVCANPYSFRAKAQGLGFDENDIEFIDYWDYIQNNYNPNRKLFIDEIDGLLEAIGGHVMGYCLTPDE